MAIEDAPNRRTSSRTSSTTVVITPMHGLLVLIVLAFLGGLGFARLRARLAVANAPVAAPQAVAPVQRSAGVVTLDGVQQVPAGQYRQELSEIMPGVILDVNSDSMMVGREFIDIAGESLDGQRSSIADYIGQPIMVNFWATWCPPCRIEMPWMERVYQEFKDDGFVILAVNAGERVSPDQVLATVQRYVVGDGLTFPILMPDDPYTAQVEYSVFGLPSSYLIDPNGVVVDAHRGMYPNEATLRDRVVKLMSGELSDDG